MNGKGKVFGANFYIGKLKITEEKNIKAYKTSHNVVNMFLKIQTTAIQAGQIV